MKTSFRLLALLIVLSMLVAACGGAGGCFEDRIFALMIRIVEDFQKKIEERLQKLEEDIKALEDEGAKADAKRKVKDAGEREMKQRRDRVERDRNARNRPQGLCVGGFESEVIDDFQVWHLRELGRGDDDF